MRNNDGFTLIEVLIALMVMALGLLGLAGMQITGIKSNQTAYNRSQATQLAYDIADRMRSNPGALDNYLSTFMLPASATCSTSNTPCTACRSTTNTCSPAQLAVRDLYDWNTALSKTLPQATGSITRAGVVYTVTIVWDENGQNGTADDAGFQTNFRL